MPQDVHCAAKLRGGRTLSKSLPEKSERMGSVTSERRWRGDDMAVA